MNIRIRKSVDGNKCFCEGCGGNRNAIISFNYASSVVWLCDKCVEELFDKIYDYLESEE